MENQPVYTDIPYQVSWLDGEKKLVGFDAFGMLEKPSDIAMAGSMSAARIADLLPVDFQSDFPSILIFNCRKLNTRRRKKKCSRENLENALLPSREIFN